MNADNIINILVGLGIIGAMWRMTGQVAGLTASMKIYIKRTDDHEVRIRDLED